jgi:hypothetical protein
MRTVWQILASSKHLATEHASIHPHATSDLALRVKLQPDPGIAAHAIASTDAA